MPNPDQGARDIQDSSTEQNAATLARLLAIVHSNVSPEVEQRLRIVLNKVVLDYYKAGVQNGYRSLLQNHRDGHLNINLASTQKIDHLLADALAHVEPSQLFPVEETNED